MTTAQIKEIKALYQKKFRDETGLFVVEGEKMVEEALRSSFDVLEVIRKDDVGENVMSRISSLSTPSPVLAIVKQKVGKGFLAPNKGLYLALDSIRDPGNLGTIIRVADWFGIDGIIATEDSVDLYNPKVVQSTMGAIFRVDFQYVNLPKALAEIKKCKGMIFGTFLDGSNIYSTDLSTGSGSPAVIVIGNESNGISDDVSRIVDTRLHIPAYPVGKKSGSESLNAAVATAITVAEFTRRRY